MDRSGHTPLRAWVLGSATTLLLFLSYLYNILGVAPPATFHDFQYDSESLVLGRMVQSRQEGVFSYNGLLGWGDADAHDLHEGDYRHQHDTYLSGGRFQSYSPYESASGGQALLFSVMHIASPYSPVTDLHIFQAIMALLLAGTMTIFVLWSADEFGPAVGILVAAGILLSTWPTLFGRSLFYFIWASFLPLGSMAWYLASEQKGRARSDLGPALLAFLAVSWKCLTNGYDFALPALAMPVIPFLYYAIRDRWDASKLLRRCGLLALGLLLAVGASILILAYQLQVTEGSVAGGLESIVSTLARRTYLPDAGALPDYAAAVESTSLSTVLWTYVSQDTVMAFPRLRALDLLGIFAAVTCAYIVLHLLRPGWVSEERKSSALVLATWLSLLSPLSWFVLFKGQAVVHTHTNYLAWHMPFAIFGFVMTGWIARTISLAVWQRFVSARATSPVD